jgi:WhiB family redox-sensing transcriptional regulator
MTVFTNWRDDIACRDADPDLFFPIGTTGTALRQIDEAKRICRVCPAQIRCLSWALDNGVTDGVWGGTTPDERRAIRSLPDERPPARKTTMTRAITQQSTENMEYVRRLLHQKQPGFSAALELALMLAEPELWPSPMPPETSAATAHDR